MKNLREIENTNFLTDGKSMFYIGDITDMRVSTINEVGYDSFEGRILENSYTKNMKVINENLLSDGVTLISENEKITIKDLKLNVKILD